MKNQFLLLGALSTGMLLSCNSPQPNETAHAGDTAMKAAAQPAMQSAAMSATQTGDEHNSRNSVDWYGVYKGTVPCADCNGIETTITLARDNTFTRNQVYSGKSDQAIFDKGSFTWDSTGSNISIKGQDGTAQVYKVGENVLFLLDKNGKRITGSNADKYILKKNATDVRIEGKKWMLTELMGKKIDARQLGKQAFIQLDAETGTFAGNGSCNNVFGSYEIKDGGRISFGKAASTMMACKDMSTEKTLLEVLQRTDNYSVNDTSFTLNKARMAPLARFSVAKP